MINFRSMSIATASAAMQVALLNAPVLAADLPGLKDTAPMVEAPPMWEGFYFGGHAGGVWNAPKVTDTFTYQGDPTINSRPFGKGFIGGAQGGYNFQRGHFVFGPEADIGYLGISASKSFFKPGEHQPAKSHIPAITFVTHYEPGMCDVAGKYTASSDLYGDLTARLGYEMESHTPLRERRRGAIARRFQGKLCGQQLHARRTHY